jgi:hypothetical protein
MNDFRGRPIVPGCIVVYPVRVSSSVWVVEAEVLEVHEPKHLRPNWRDQGSIKVRRLRSSDDPYFAPREVTVTSMDRVVVVESPGEENSSNTR